MATKTTKRPQQVTIRVFFSGELIEETTINGRLVAQPSSKKGGKE